MRHPVIPLLDVRWPTPPPILEHNPAPPTDQLGRPLRELRISVTDRCNFRCTYCMPREVFSANHAFLPQPDLLTFEEITRLAKLFVAQGVEKIRLTGGEPLLRKNLESLIESLVSLRTASGLPLDLSLTTNGSTLPTKARALKAAGLQRITVSLDALDAKVFHQMTDSHFTPDDVLRGIDAAQKAGIDSIKVNMVVQRSVNAQQILPMARHFRHSGIVLRFIEYMDVGSTNGWNLSQVVPSAEVIQQLQQEFDLIETPARHPSETARRWRYQDGGGEIGLISSVTQAFCNACTRARLSPNGQLYLCLFGHQGHDLRTLVRDGRTDDQISTAIASIWSQRSDRYSLQRGQAALADRPPKIEMHYIGG